VPVLQLRSSTQRTLAGLLGLSRVSAGRERGAAQLHERTDRLIRIVQIDRQTAQAGSQHARIELSQAANAGCDMSDDAQTVPTWHQTDAYGYDLRVHGVEVGSRS